jgi:hypothetical protein
MEPFQCRKVYLPDADASLESCKSTAVGEPWRMVVGMLVPLFAQQSMAPQLEGCGAIFGLCSDAWR